MLPPRPLRWHDALLLIAGYVVLDWASYLHPLHGLNITPWNPAPGLVLVFLLRHGKWAALPTVIAIVLAEIWVRGLPLPLPMTFALAILLSAGYSTIALLLSRFIGEVTFLSDRESLFTWAVIVSLGTLINSVLFVLPLYLTGHIPATDLQSAIHQYWVGDAAGVLIAMPLLWLLLADRGRLPPIRTLVVQRDFLAQLLITIGALWIAFGLGDTADPRYLYALFLPIAWTASRSGLPGTVLAIATIQVGIIVAVRWHGHAALTILDVQVLAAVIALFGLFIAIVVEEKDRLGRELRHTLRLAAAGEMAGALAHELNQPLTALSTYGSACAKLLENGEVGPRLQMAVSSMVQEAFRASAVLRRLREFFQSGTTQLECVPLASLIAGAVDSLSERARREDVRITVAPVPRATLLGDRLQLEVILRNLLTNAIEATSVRPANDRRVTLHSMLLSDTHIRIDIEDNGDGLTPERLTRLFDGFQSTKSSGMGLGLFISRAIAEAHGGSLAAEASGHGVFRLTLPIEEDNHAR